MNPPISITERTRLLLSQWRKGLELTKLEKTQFKEELESIDYQLKRLSLRTLQVSVFGRVGVGKSSLLNALVENQVFATNIIHGSTNQSQVTIWNEPINNLQSVELIDTPGIDEINTSLTTKLNFKAAKKADLILFVIDSDLTNVDLKALQIMASTGKPILLILNRCDQWNMNEVNQLKKSIKARLPSNIQHVPIKAVAAAPRISKILANGKIRSTPCVPEISSLRESLINLLENQGELLLALNCLRRADDFYSSLKKGRLKRGKLAAQGVIGKFAALKASGVAASPLLMLDLTAGIACDTALVIELSNLYGLQLRGPAARELMKKLSLYNALLGGTQVSIQLALGICRHILLIASPFTGGLSLFSAAPIALAQAAIAVHTTKLTGRLAAKEFLRGTHRRGIQPRSMLQRLASQDPEVKLLLKEWPNSIINSKSYDNLQTLVP